jgi:hypothetical protein
VSDNLQLESSGLPAQLANSTQAFRFDPSTTKSLWGYTFQHPDLWLYRERTLALLRRYLRISIEVGRLPSLLGRELFRSKVTSYRMTSFEDAVIFVYDVERALEKLDTFGKQLIATIVFQDYTQDEAAEILRCARRTVCRNFPKPSIASAKCFCMADCSTSFQGGLWKIVVKRESPLFVSQLIANKPNKNVQSVAQLPFQPAILKIERRNSALDRF